MQTERKRSKRLRFFIEMKTKAEENRSSIVSDFVLIPVLLAASLFLAGCNKASYPEDRVASAIQEICRDEYKVEDVEVKFAGKTIGVFLPLKKLFTTDVRQEILSGHITNLESLFEPEPEAMEQLENVLFTISRVLLSSDKPIDFYVLEATDIESTGLQLVLMGYVPDIRRVRLWDISRTEYRKRVLHELKFNRSVLWEKPVREFYRDVSNLDFKTLTDAHFLIPPSPETVSPLFYDLLAAKDDKENLRVVPNDIRSRSYRDAQALVYAKLTESYDQKPGVEASSYLYPSGTMLEYIFVVEPTEKQFKIAQVIPFYYLNQEKKLEKIPLPSELQLDQSVNEWPERFSVEEIMLGEFLARQMNRRIQAALLGDERIHHTIRHARVNFSYRHGAEGKSGFHEEPFFALYFDFLAKGMKPSRRTMGDVIFNEDVLYLFDLILREFTDVVRSYRFGDYTYLELIWEPGDASTVLRLGPDRLDLFRTRKLNVSTLLESPSHSIFKPS